MKYTVPLAPLHASVYAGVLRLETDAVNLREVEIELDRGMTPTTVLISRTSYILA